MATPSRILSLPCINRNSRHPLMANITRQRVRQKPRERGITFLIQPKGHRTKVIILQPFLRSAIWLLQKFPTVPDHRPPRTHRRQHIPSGHHKDFLTSTNSKTPCRLTLRVRLLLSLGPRAVLIACLPAVGVLPSATDPSYVGHTTPTLLHIDQNGLCGRETYPRTRRTTSSGGCSARPQSHASERASHRRRAYSPSSLSRGRAVCSLTTKTRRLCMRRLRGLMASLCVRTNRVVRVWCVE